MRALVLIFTVGWQALAGSGGLLAYCHARNDYQPCAGCPDRAMAVAAGTTPDDSDASSFKRASCCTVERVEVARHAAVHELTFAGAVAPALPVTTVVPALELDGSPTLRALSTVAQSQGPPVYLKIRTLLI